jgi:hypothetical protein
MDLTVDLHITGTFSNLTSDEVAEMVDAAKENPIGFIDGLNGPVVDVEVHVTA